MSQAWKMLGLEQWHHQGFSQTWESFQASHWTHSVLISQSFPGWLHPHLHNWQSDFLIAALTQHTKETEELSLLNPSVQNMMLALNKADERWLKRQKKLSERK